MKGITQCVLLMQWCVLYVNTIVYTSIRCWWLVCMWTQVFFGYLLRRNYTCQPIKYEAVTMQCKVRNKCISLPNKIFVLYLHKQFLISYFNTVYYWVDISHNFWGERTNIIIIIRELLRYIHKMSVPVLSFHNFIN